MAGTEEKSIEASLVDAGVGEVMIQVLRQSLESAHQSAALHMEWKQQELDKWKARAFDAEDELEAVRFNFSKMLYPV